VVYFPFLLGQVGRAPRPGRGIVRACRLLGPQISESHAPNTFVAVAYVIDLALWWLISREIGITSSNDGLV
jgi:hypothetical protein